jgi:hypothetical protein
MDDRVFYPDIEKAALLIHQGRLAELLPMPPLDTVLD